MPRKPSAGAGGRRRRGVFPRFFLLSRLFGFPSSSDASIVESRPHLSQGDSTKFYDALGISKSADAAEIKKAYRKAAIKNHPDKGGDPEKFKELQLMVRGGLV